MPMDRDAWLKKGGEHNWSKTPAGYRVDALRRLLPWVPEVGVFVTLQWSRERCAAARLKLPTSPQPRPQETGSFTPELLRQTARSQFRAPPPAAGGETELLDRAFTSLRVLSEQLHLARCSSTATTEGIHVEVTTSYVGKQAELDPTYDDEDGTPPKLLFTYRVRVSNLG